MSKTENIISGIIIQARMGSTRLKGKILMPITGQQSILDILLSRLKRLCPELPLVVATTTSEEDNAVVELCRKKDIIFFRGDETNVLNRFISCADHYGFQGSVIRICADNPFLDMELLATLMEEAQRNNADYVSFKIDGKPTILTHYGFFAEIVKVGALKSAAQLTQDPLYTEHVTNYIYNHPETFDIRLVETSLFRDYPYVRLTIDNQADFNIASQILSELDKKDLDFNWKDVLAVVGKHPEMADAMQDNIKKYNKG